MDSTLLYYLIGYNLILLLVVLEVPIAPDLTSESLSVSSLTWPVPSFSEDFLALGTRFCRSFSVSSAGVTSPWNLGDCI